MRTLAQHSRTIAALHALAAEYPLLPAVDIRIVSISPGELMLSTWNLADFEQWREALHVDADSVEYEVTSVSQVHLLAEASYDGVTVLLNGYTQHIRQQKAQVAA